MSKGRTAASAVAKTEEENNSSIRLKVNGEALSVNVDELELQEIEVLEGLMDRPLEDIDFRRAAAIRGLIYIAKRRKDPTYTLDQTRGLKLEDFSDPDEKPKDGEGEGNPPTEASS